MIPSFSCGRFECVLLCGLASALIVVCLSWMAVRRFHRRQVLHLLQEEQGAAYMISYVMVVPLYAFMICMVVETSALLPAKLGTVQAAYSAARTAIVWSSATHWSNAQSKAVAAARRSFVPFASSTQDILLAQHAAAAERYTEACRQFAKAPIKEGYLRSKFAFAHYAVNVQIYQPATWNDDVTATVTYEFPFNIPVAARIFGDQRADGSRFLPITSSATLQNEGSQTLPNRYHASPLGIGYGTLE